MNTSAPRIALISAVTSAWDPIHEAFRVGYPQAELWNLLDDRLLADADASGGLAAPLRGRMDRLIDQALDGGADGVLLTCSLYGPVAHDRDGSVPVHGPDDALFAEVAHRRPARAIVVSSGEAPLTDSTRRLAAVLSVADNASAVEVVPALVEGVVKMNRHDDPEAVQAAVVEAVRAAVGGAVSPSSDLVILGQYSLAPTAPAARDALGVPVLAGPPVAVAALRARLADRATCATSEARA